MFILLQTATGSYINATLEVIIYMGIAAILGTLFWYFAWHKKDRREIDSLRKNLDKLQPKHDVLTNQHEHLKAEYGKIKQGLAELMDNYQALSNQHRDYVATQSSAQSLYEQADEERQSLLDSYESMEANYLALDTKYNDIVDTLDRLEEEVDNLKDEKFELEELNKQLRKEIQQLEEVLEEEGLNIESIRASFEDGSTPEEDEIERLIGAAKGFNLKTGDTSLPADTSDIINIDEFIDGEEKVKEVTTEGDQEKKEALQAVYDALKEDYNQIRNEHTKLTNQFQELQEIHQQLQTEKETMIETAVSLDDFEQLKEKYQTLTLENTQLKENKEIELHKYEDTLNLLKQKEEEILALNKKVELGSTIQASSSHVKNFEDLKATNQALYSNNKVLNERNADFQKQIDLLAGENSGLKSQFNLLRDQFAQLEIENDELKANDKGAEVQRINKERFLLEEQLKKTLANQNSQRAKVLELEQLLKSINESSGYGIIYLPSNLQIIEGIGQRVEQLFNKANIHTWADLAKTDLEQLNKILKEGGKRFAALKADSWPKQAQLLVKGNWKAFRNLEAELIAAKKSKSIELEYDDLKVIEGIGPKIEVLLNNANIHTWKKLSKTGIGELRRILKKAGSQYEMHDPLTWPEQAALAAAWDWTALEHMQKEMKGGIREGN
jgi:predicted flap endonuclease-1-like 5' DNA nuclease